MNIVQDMLPPTHPLDKLPMTPEYITIHETANVNPGANAKMHGEYMRTQDAIDREVMWHFTVDDHEVRQHLPAFVCGWHAGDGWSGTGNRKSIGIEICVNSDGDFEKAKQNASALIADLLKTVKSLRPFPECVVQHNHWSGKDCPHFIRSTPGGWDKFLAMVKEQVEPVKPPLTVTLDGEVIPECIPTKVDGKVRVNLRPVIERAKGRVVVDLMWDEETQTANVVTRPERSWWQRLMPQ